MHAITMNCCICQMLEEGADEGKPIQTYRLAKGEWERASDHHDLDLPAFCGGGAGGGGGILIRVDRDF